MLDKIHLKISVFAALVVLVLSMVEDAPILVIVPRLIAAIVIFYFVGLVVRFYLRKHVFPPEEVEDGLFDAPGKGEGMIMEEETEEEPVEAPFYDFGQLPGEEESQDGN